MKNLWNSAMSTWETILRMTPLQQLTLIGFIILPGASLILIFSLFVRQITQKPAKTKITKTFGNIKCSLCDETFPNGTPYRKHWEEIHLDDALEYSKTNKKQQKEDLK